jgi:arylsulfatase A-like enzyme
MAFTDAQIGRLLAQLRKTGRLTNAVVLFTSDHGENFGEAGLFYAHGPNVHDASLRVPLIVAGVGLRRGATRREVVRLIDIAPTVLSLAKIPKASWPSMGGVDHSDALREGSAAAPEKDLLAFAESGGTLVRGNHTHLLSGRPRTGYCVNKEEYSLCWLRDVVPPALFDRSADAATEKNLRDEKPDLYAEMLRARERWKPGTTRERSVSDGRLKLVERPRFEGGYARSLYDVSKDPAEEIEVRKEYPKDYLRLAQALDAWTANVPGYTQVELSDEAEAQLKALGYIE